MKGIHLTLLIIIVNSLAYGQIMFNNTSKFPQLKLIADKLNSISNYQAECDMVIESLSHKLIRSASTLISHNVPTDTLCGFYYFFKTQEQYRKNGGDFTAYFNNAFYMSMQNEISKHTSFDEPKRFQVTKIGNRFIPAIHRSSLYIRVIPKEMSKYIYKSLSDNKVVILQKPDSIINDLNCNRYTIKTTNSTLSSYTELYFDKKSLHLILYKESSGGLTPEYIIAKLSNIKVDQKIASDFFSEENLFGSKIEINKKNTTSKFKVGQAAPDWELPALGEIAYYSSKKMRGKYLLLEFTTTWCHYCRDAVKMMNRIEDEFKGNEKFGAFSIFSTDMDDPETISRFAKGQKIKSTILHSASIVGDKYGIKGYPSFFIIDPAGKIVLEIVGFSQESEEKVVSFLKDKIN